MGRSTNVPFSILISARLPLLTLRASATAFGMRTARLFPHLQNSTIMTLLRKVDTMYIQCSYGLQAFWTGGTPMPVACSEITPFGTRGAGSRVGRRCPTMGHHHLP